MPEIFSPEINWINLLTEEHEYETTLFHSKADFDQRQSLIDVPHRRLTYTISSMDDRESARFEALIRKVQGELCYVPYWRGARYLTQPSQGSAGAKTRLYMNDVASAGFEIGNYVMLFRGPHQVTVDKIYKILNDSIITDTVLPDTWPARLTKAVPAFLGQLAPEVDLDYVERSLKQATVTFDLKVDKQKVSADCNWAFREAILNPLHLTWEIDPTGGPSGGPALKATIPPNSGSHTADFAAAAYISIIGLPLSDILVTYPYTLEVDVKTDWNIATADVYDGIPGITLSIGSSGPLVGTHFEPATGAAYNAWQHLNTSNSTSYSGHPDGELTIGLEISEGTSDPFPHTVWFSQVILRDGNGNVVHTCLPSVPPGVTGATPIFAPLDALHRPGQSLQKVQRSVDQLSSPAGVFSIRTKSLDPLPQHPLDLVFFTDEQWATFRAFHDLVQGAFGAFWVPSYQQDLTPIDVIGGSDVEFDIEDIGYTDLYFPSLLRRQIAFVQPNGSFLKRTIVSSVKNGDGTETIEINEALGNPFQQNNANGICFLWYGRFSDDVARTDWMDADQATMSLAMTELRDPPDGGSGNSADGYLSDTP